MVIRTTPTNIAPGVRRDISDVVAWFQTTLQDDKIPVFIRTQMAVEWILSTVHTFRRENFLLV